jgi:hypothetical protein
MTAFADMSRAFEIRDVGRAHSAQGHPQHLSLRATGDGWSLLGPEGELVFQAIGLAGRRACLEYAREHGVLAVLG